MIENLIHSREYKSNDKDEVLAILNLNVLNILLKRNWGARGLPKIQNWTVLRCCNYDEIIGACGINFEDNGKSAKISWDFIDPKFKGKRCWTIALKYRVNFIKNQITMPQPLRSELQLAYKFMRKWIWKKLKEEMGNGFRLIQYDLRIKFFQF
jgi:hypothetical protein